MTLLVAVVSFGINAQTTTSLDGKKFKIEAWDETKSDLKTPEELIFKNGMVDAPICHEYGFFASRYKATDEDGVIKFTFVNESEYEGELIFEGYVDGKTVNGTYTWKKEGRDDLKYQFQGKLN